MTDEKDDLSNDPVVRAARIKKYEAEAELATAQAAERRWRVEEAKLEVEDLQKDRKERDASNAEHRVYDLVGRIDHAMVEAALATLSRWARLGATNVTIRITSGGGEVIAGYGLYDFIVDYMRGSKGIYVTTVGMAISASMAAVLLQSGDRRMLGGQAYMLIHEVSAGAIGKVSEMEDEVTFARKLNDRAVDIFASRAKGSAASKPMSRAQIRTHSKRKDFWINAQDALKWGFIDGIGYEV